MARFLTFRLDPDQSAQLKISAERQGLTVQGLMELIVKDHIASEKRSRPPDISEAISIIRAKKSDLASRGVAQLSIFGSTARGEGRPDSDVDIVIEISGDTLISLTGFARLKGDLENMLGRPVDLVEWRNLEPRLRSFVERDAVKVF